MIQLRRSMSEVCRNPQPHIGENIMVP